jgi:hypothetical protein
MRSVRSMREQGILNSSITPRFYMSRLSSLTHASDWVPFPCCDLDALYHTQISGTTEKLEHD